MWRLVGVDMKAHDLSVLTQDNFYWYDGLQQVKRHDRGDLTPSAQPYTGIDPVTRQLQEDFTYDETGNWLGYQSSSPVLVQTRTHNKANEIATIPSPSGTIQPVYDPAGNMTTMPKPTDWTAAYTCKWDAWNRLVEIKAGSSVVSSFKYDASTRRIEKTSTEGTRHYFYDQQWRSVEERLGGSTIAQYTWNPDDRWNLIRRRRSAGGALNETHYVLRDYLDPVAIVDASGTVQERYGYDTFGSARIMEDDFDPRSSSGYAWNWLFHGEFIDEENGLYNYGYRHYSPSLGRWASRDPLGIRVDPNLYRFLFNHPPNGRDFLGLDEWDDGGDQVTWDGSGLTPYPPSPYSNPDLEPNQNEQYDYPQFPDGPPEGLYGYTCYGEDSCAGKEFDREKQCCKNGEILDLIPCWQSEGHISEGAYVGHHSPHPTSIGAGALEFVPSASYINNIVYLSKCRKKVCPEWHVIKADFEGFSGTESRPWHG